ncbi:sulfatase-like hydrolase/transferase, partial [Verrucomicrobia bacterium]|nr:sulfatase-like hydrolase/transferase [Verrucomicrobiota bacterium]
GPSRACILTGKHSHINGFRRNGNRFDGTQPTFPKMLQGAGYQTALIGKWHLGTDPTGFNYWEVLPGQGSYYNPDFLQMDGTKKRYTGYCTDIITNQAISWLDNRDKDKPFVLMCQHKAPHRNWSPHPRHFDLFKGKEVPEPDSLFDTYEGRTKLLKDNEMSIANHMHWQHDMKFKGDNLFPENFEGRVQNAEYRRMTDEQKKTWDAWYEPRNQKFISDMKAGKLTDKEIIQWKYQRYITDYLKSVQAVDDGVGEVLDYLDKNNLTEDTIVIYSSDQGFYLGEHGWYDKRWMFEESLRMPFLIRWPGVVNPGSTSHALIQNIDYAPTFLDIVGAPIPADIQGRSLVPLLKRSGDAPADWRDSIYYAYYENAAVHNTPNHDGIRTENHKLMWFPRTREYQLFDLVNDPQEMNSVHEHSDYTQILEGLKQRLVDQRKFYDLNPALIPSTRGDESRWRERDQLLTQRTRQSKPDLVFIGDSITQGWEGRGKKVWDKYYGKRNALNIGIGGDRTEHVIWRLTHGQNLGKKKPKAAVVMIGTNNTGHFDQDPEQVAQGVEEILSILDTQIPNAKILLMGVFPRGKDNFDPKRLNNNGINQRIRRLADGDRVHYMDISDILLQEDGTATKDVMPDLLHLSEEGYERWAKTIEPKLKEFGL